MRGEQYLTRKEQFALVFDRGESRVGKGVVIRALPNGLTLSRYGFVVSRRIGKAVVRNRVKRRLREIVRQTLLGPGWDIVIIARSGAAEIDYSELRESVKILLSRGGILAGEYESVSPAAD